MPGLFILLIAALVFSADVIPFLRGGYGWQWPYVPVAFIRLMPLIAGAALALSGSVLLLRARLRWQIAWSWLSVSALTLAALSARHDQPGVELILRTLSPLTTGAHAAAMTIDWDDPAWLEWANVMVDLEGQIAHVNLAPPALPLMYAAVGDGFEHIPDSIVTALAAPIMAAQCHNYALLDYTPAQWAAAWVGVLMPLWAGLAVIPLVALARRLHPDTDRPAHIAAALYPLVPSLLIFAPSWNTVYPLLSLTAFWLLDRGLSAADRSRFLWTFAAGAAAGLCIFVNFAFVPLGLLFGLYALTHWHGVDRPAGRSLTHIIGSGMACTAGAALPWGVYGMLTGSWPWELLSTSMGMHLELERDYLPWIWLHGWDWALWTGLPVIGLWLLAALRRSSTADGRLALALLVTIGILLVSNFARGETGRVWTLFVPFVVIAGASVLADLRQALPVVLLTGIAQSAWLIALTAVIDAVAVDLSLPPAAPAPQIVSHALEAVFADQFTLVGWDAAAVEGGIQLRLNWRAETVNYTPYWLSALLVDSSGAVIGESVVWQPNDTRYPITCWKPGEVIGDEIRIPLPSNAPPGDYWISVTAFADDAGLNRLPVRLPGSDLSDQVGLGPVSSIP